MFAKQQDAPITKTIYNISHELCFTDEELLLRGDRIVIPSKLRHQAIHLEHEDHAGMDRCKQRLRSNLWWPEMDKQVEENIRCCHPCQLVGHSPRPEPVKPTTLPKQPRSKLAIGACVPFPTGEQVVVLQTIIHAGQKSRSYSQSRRRISSIGYYRSSQLTVFLTK